MCLNGGTVVEGSRCCFPGSGRLDLTGFAGAVGIQHEFFQCFHVDQNSAMA